MARTSPDTSLDTQLDAHRAALSACRRCANVSVDVKPILSLARHPRIMLIGQAPGKTEIANQRPFAGRAGRTLFQWLARAGLDEETARNHIYIAAVTRCYPGASPSGRGDRVPSRDECTACAPWLDAELRIIRPKLIIPVGKLAIERFLGNAPLADVIGQSHYVTYDDGRGQTTAIPLPHPSGASSWIHTNGHGRLLTRALELLQTEFQQLLGYALQPSA